MELINGENISEFNNLLFSPQEKSHQRPQILEKSDNKEQSGSRSNTASFMFFFAGNQIFLFCSRNQSRKCSRAKIML